MLVPLRARPPAPPSGDPIDTLLACHDRIRTFLRTAERAIAAGPEVPAREVADAGAAVARYFSVAFPLHAEDEDRSLAPRLARHELPAEVAQAVAAGTEEHVELETLAAALVASARAIAADPGARAAIAPRVREEIARLRALVEPHLAREESVVFPAVRRLLGPEDLAGIVQEIRARRERAGFVPESAPGVRA